MKKILMLLLAVVMVLALAACGGNGGTPDAPTTQGQETTPPATQDETPSTPDAPQNGTNGDSGSSCSEMIGEIIEMGGLDWIVLTVEDGRALLLSYYTIGNRRFDATSSDWETSEMREFLNGEFIESTFSASERESIVETRLANSAGNRTTDHIFLLSLEEVLAYMGGWGMQNTHEYMGDNANETIINARRTLSVEMISSGFHSNWWLRTPGPRGSGPVPNVMHVNSSGNATSHGRSANEYDCVRPAFWLYLYTPQNVINDGSTRIGDIIEKANINWLVIAVEDGQALLLSDRLLEGPQFDVDDYNFGEWDWESSRIRAYLNDEFFNSTFSASERNRIVEASLANPDGSTIDRVFLLSNDEVNEHMGTNAPMDIRNARIASRYGFAVPTEWGLRSPGELEPLEAGIPVDWHMMSYRGHVTSGFRAGFPGRAMRPAFWLDLN